MRSIARTVKVPIPIIEAIECLRKPGQPLSDYPSTNAALVGLLRYAIAFPKPHRLTAGIARLPQSEQDEIDDFLAECARTGRSLSDETKPLTAAGLLNLSRK